MPHYDELYPKRFLKATTLERPRVIRILGLGVERLQGDDGEKAKGVLRYRDAAGEGEIVWCHTNAVLTAKALGVDDYTQWAGHLLTIHNDPTVRFGSEVTGGVRVYGSPELAATKRVEIKRPRRRKPEVYTLHRTDKAGNPIDDSTTTTTATATTDAEQGA